MAQSRRRKRFNRIVRVLSEIYNREYIEVLRLYNKMEGNVEHTKSILNLTSL
jgi:hypothetical protein